MPQFEPFTLSLQWNSTILLISFTTILLACYILPLITRLNLARVRVCLFNS